MQNMLLFDSKGFRDYEFWQNQDRKTLKRINRLIKSIQREGPLNGEGDPEKLSNAVDTYSRRIDGKNRLVYVFKDNNTLVTACEGHYDHGVSKEKSYLMPRMII